MCVRSMHTKNSSRHLRLPSNGQDHVLMEMEWSHEQSKVVAVVCCSHLFFFVLCVFCISAHHIPSTSHPTIPNDCVNVLVYLTRVYHHHISIVSSCNFILSFLITFPFFFYAFLLSLLSICDPANTSLVSFF